jgi:hypothetical protein
MVAEDLLGGWMRVPTVAHDALRPPRDIAQAIVAEALTRLSR